jgi:hypothetical protein
VDARRDGAARKAGPDSVPRRHSLTRPEPRAAATRATFATTDVDICE